MEALEGQGQRMDDLSAGPHFVQPGYTLVTRLTHEMTSGEIEGYCALFEAVFHKGKSPSEFVTQFSRPHLGHSFHSLLVHEGRTIIGGFTVCPERFTVFGEERVLGLSVDTMIHPDHRTNPFFFMNMANACGARLAQAGISFLFGFPNENSRTYFEKVLRWQRIGELPFHVLPISLGIGSPFLRPLDVIYRPLLGLFLWIATKTSSNRSFSWAIKSMEKEKPEDYLHIPGRKSLELEGGAFAIYSVHQEKARAMVGYLLDIKPLNRRSVFQAVAKLRKEEPEIDLIAYVGVLPFHSLLLPKAPKTLLPRRILMSGKALAPDFPVAEARDFAAWLINLSSFDVR